MFRPGDPAAGRRFLRDTLLGAPLFFCTARGDERVGGRCYCGVLKGIKLMTE